MAILLAQLPANRCIQLNAANLFGMLHATHVLKPPERVTEDQLLHIPQRIAAFLHQAVGLFSHQSPGLALLIKRRKTVRDHVEIRSTLIIQMLQQRRKRKIIGIFYPYSQSTNLEENLKEGSA